MKEEKFHQEVHTRNVEIETLLKERDHLLQRLRSAEGIQLSLYSVVLLFSHISLFSESHNQDKKTLSEEIIELRKRLDDSLPEITKKESLVTRWQTDYQEILSKLRAAEAVIDAMQQQVRIYRLFII